MKKIFFVALALFATLSASAQYTKFDAKTVTSATAHENDGKTKKEVKAKKNAKEETAPVMKIEAKYAQGSCPVVDGKIEWETTILCPGLSPKQIYDRALKFLAPYCKEKDKDEHSQIALVNPTTSEIGARIGEYVVFQSTALSLDRAMMYYTLCLYCMDGKCKVIMRNISYRYEDSKLPCEEMLLDENALNKTKTNFCKGGYKKFRTKTIDAKDTLFKRLADALKQ